MAQNYLGFASWTPTPDSVDLLDKVNDIITAYTAYLPLTARQVFYRLVGACGYPKDEKAYSRLLYNIQRARRAGMLDWHAIRDDGVTSQSAGHWTPIEDPTDWLKLMMPESREYVLNPQDDQEHYIELWCEAAGMVPMLSGMVRDFGIPVYSSSGFDSVTAKYDAYRRFVSRSVPTRVLHVGDYDPSGWAIFQANAEDITAFGASAEFIRVAVLARHIARYSLPTAPPKAKDKRRGFTDTRTVQAEALDPADLERLVRDAIEVTWDHAAASALTERQREARAEIDAKLDEFGL